MQSGQSHIYDGTHAVFERRDVPFMPFQGRKLKNENPSTKHQNQTHTSRKNEPHATLGGKYGGNEDKGRIHKAA